MLESTWKLLGQIVQGSACQAKELGLSPGGAGSQQRLWSRETAQTDLRSLQ